MSENEWKWVEWKMSENERALASELNEFERDELNEFERIWTRRIERIWTKFWAKRMSDTKWVEWKMSENELSEKWVKMSWVKMSER